MDIVIEEFTNIEQSHTTTTLNQVPILLCLSCQTRIPQIKIIKDGITLKLEMKCHYCKHEAKLTVREYLELMKRLKTRKYCELLPNHNKLFAVMYCLEENKWLCKICVSNHRSFSSTHNLSLAKIQLDPKCKLHKKKNKLICKNCHVEICKVCKGMDVHKNHHIVDLEAVKKEFNERIDAKKENKTTRDTNQQNVDTLIKILTSKIQEFTQLKKDLEEIYSVYVQNNQILLEFIVTAEFNYENLNTFPIPELLSNLIINSDTNDQKLEINTEQLEQSCLTAIKFFKINNIVKLPNTRQSIIKQNAHADLITSMILLQDNRIATGSCDTKIKIWTITNEFNDIPKELSGHKGKVLALIQLKNADLVSGSDDHSIIIWNVRELKQLKQLKGHEDCVYCLLENTKTNKLISASSDETIRIWNLKTETSNIIKEDTSILAQLDDERIVTTSDFECSIKLWDPTSFTLFKTLESHKQEINVVCQLRNSKLASGSYDEIIIWDLVTYTQIEKIVSENDTFSIVYSMTQLCDGTLVLGCNNTIFTLCLNKMEINKTYEDHKDIITSVVQLKDKRIASCSWDNSIQIWNIDN